MSKSFFRKTQSFYSAIFKLSFVLFIFTNALLFYFLYDGNETLCSKESTCRTDKKFRMLPREKWGHTVYFKTLLKNFRLIDNEWRLVSLTDGSNDLNNELNCSSLHQVTNMKYIAAGWTKLTYKVNLNNMTVSLKIVNIDGQDVSSCLLEEDRYLYDCFLLAASKLLREISVLRSISHPNVIKILGYCVPAHPDINNPLQTVAIFEEYGEPINIIKMLQLSWEDRLRISLGLSRLLNHLASFKIPVALNDFRRQQFVVIDGDLKLIDVDDVGLQEPKCDGTPCCLSLSSTDNKTSCVPCVNNVCKGYNEKMNILKTGGHFIRHILPHGAPSNLDSKVLKITSAFEFASWNSADILKEMEDLTALFKSGWYRRSSTEFLSDFKVLEFKDLSSDYDYRCQATAFGYGCVMSVINPGEAAEICINDVDCKAFVITNTTTWTGRRVVIFKNGVGKLIDNNSSTVYVKS